MPSSRSRAPSRRRRGQRTQVAGATSDSDSSHAPLLPALPRRHSITMANVSRAPDTAPPVLSSSVAYPLGTPPGRGSPPSSTSSSTTAPSSSKQHNHRPELAQYRSASAYPHTKRLPKRRYWGKTEATRVTRKHPSTTAVPLETNTLPPHRLSGAQSRRSQSLATQPRTSGFFCGGDNERDDGLTAEPLLGPQPRAAETTPISSHWSRPPSAIPTLHHNRDNGQSSSASPTRAPSPNLPRTYEHQAIPIQDQAMKEPSAHLTETTVNFKPSPVDDGVLHPNSSTPRRAMGEDTAMIKRLRHFTKRPLPGHLRADRSHHPYTPSPIARDALADYGTTNTTYYNPRLLTEPQSPRHFFHSSAGMLHECMSDISPTPMGRSTSAIFLPLPNSKKADADTSPSARHKSASSPDWDAIRYFTQNGDLPPLSSMDRPSEDTLTPDHDGLEYSDAWNDDEEECYVDDANFKDPNYRFTFFSPAIGTIRARELNDLQTPHQPLGDLLMSSQGCFWINVLAPTPRDMRILARFFRIHPLTAEDIVTEDAREKCEVFRHYYFVSFRTFEMDPSNSSYLEPSSMYTVVFKEGILSFHTRVNPHLPNVLRRIRKMMDATNITPDWINYALIDDITDHFQPVMRMVEYEVDSVDELVLILNESEQSDMLRRIGLARKTVISLLRLLGAKPDVLRSLMKRLETVPGHHGSGHISTPIMTGGTDIGFYLDDIQDHLVTMLQNANHYEAILSRSHANYLAQISFEITHASNRTNDVVAKLSALASILVPLNLVTGLWGMNVPVPGQESEGLSWFNSIVVVLLVSATITILISRRMGIL